MRMQEFFKDFLPLWYSGRPTHVTAENYLLQAYKPTTCLRSGYSGIAVMFASE